VTRPGLPMAGNHGPTLSWRCWPVKAQRRRKVLMCPRCTEWGGGRLCSPAWAGGVDGGGRGVRWDSRRAGILLSVRQRTRRPARRATISAEPLRRLAPGTSRAPPSPLHGEGPGECASIRQLSGTATSACAGAEACRDAGRRPRLVGGAPHFARHASVAKACLAGARRRSRGVHPSGGASGKRHPEPRGTLPGGTSFYRRITS
jgi:hypothetical protein